MSCHIIAYHRRNPNDHCIIILSPWYRRMVTIVSSHYNHLIITMSSSYYCLWLAKLMIPHLSASISPTPCFCDFPGQARADHQQASLQLSFSMQMLRSCEILFNWTGWPLQCAAIMPYSGRVRTSVTRFFSAWWIGKGSITSQTLLSWQGKIAYGCILRKWPRAMVKVALISFQRRMFYQTISMLSWSVINVPDAIGLWNPMLRRAGEGFSFWRTCLNCHWMRQ